MPAGTIEDSEAPPAGALREAQEESGLDCLELVAFLGEQVRDMRDGGRDELHHRYFFHLRCTATPPGRWRNYEEFPSDRLAVGAVHTRPLFEFFWARLPHDVPALIADHGILLDRLIARLASHG